MGYATCKAAERLHLLGLGDLSLIAVKPLFSGFTLPDLILKPFVSLFKLEEFILKFVYKRLIIEPQIDLFLRVFQFFIRV
jgi:hypothetical protein